MEIKVACTRWSRLRGLLGRGDYPHALVLVPCNDVHTFGMTRAIDIAFLSDGGAVLESYRAVGPCKRVRCKGAHATLERIASPDPWFDLGDRVDLKRMALEAMKTRGKVE